MEELRFRYSVRSFDWLSVGKSLDRGKEQHPHFMDLSILHFQHFTSSRYTSINQCRYPKWRLVRNVLISKNALPHALCDGMAERRVELFLARRLSFLQITTSWPWMR